MSIDEELAGVMARGMLSEMVACTSTLDEIKRTTARLPYEASELRVANEAIAVWKKDGFDVVLGPFDPAYHDLPPPDRKDATREALLHGLLFVSAIALQAELLVVKEDAGRGFFGGQKARYVCYFSSGDDRYVAAGSSTWLVSAVAKLSPVLRITVSIPTPRSLAILQMPTPPSAHSASRPVQVTPTPTVTPPTLKPAPPTDPLADFGKRLAEAQVRFQKEKPGA